MAFTYTDTLATDRDKIRFYLQDTVENSGPKPADANFSDNEIAGLVTAEGAWGKAVAAGFEALAAAWRRYPSFQADGLRLDRTAIAKGYDQAALYWRSQYGVAGTTAGARTPTRVDGYSQDIDADDA